MAGSCCMPLWLLALLLIGSLLHVNSFSTVSTSASFQKVARTHRAFEARKEFSAILYAGNGDHSSQDDKVNGVNGVSTDQLTVTSAVVELEEEAKVHNADVSLQLKQLWDLSVPFFKEEGSAKALLAAVVVLTLANSAVSVAFSYVGRDFWTALSQKDPDQFAIMLQRFGGALVAGVPVTVFYRYQREKLAVAWREWMTVRVLDIYCAGKTYYNLEAERDIDNPDQRIAEDVRAFTRVSLEFLITIITSIIDLASFSTILYSIYPQLFIAIALYAGGGTLGAAALGKPLVNLNFVQLQREADFRYALVRLRENSESIAFYGGESVELAEIRRRLGAAITNFGDVIKTQRNLEFFTTSYRYLIQVLPGFVVAPLYFKGTIELGVVSQSYGAFNHILGDLSLIVNQFEALSQFSAGLSRLSEFLGTMRGDDTSSSLLAKPHNSTELTAASLHTAVTVDDHETKPKAFSGITSIVTPGAALEVKDVTVATPGGGRVLSQNVNFKLPPGGHLLVVGPSGAGKSSLLRAIAGLWGEGEGMVIRPPPEETFFLPQRPYCTLGSLRDQITYPHRKEGEPTDEQLLDLLRTVDLGALASLTGKGSEKRGLATTCDWSDILSLGEQQRLAFARLIYNEPTLAVLDEATSALDLESERRMYRLLSAVPGLSYVSVGHRPSLLAFHDQRLQLGRDGHTLQNISTQQRDSATAATTAAVIS